jgi:monoamine oxidase
VGPRVETPDADQKVLVIGAGLAGLTAATMLSRAGREVTVLEARDRVGGRTWSRQLVNGAVAEMGAEFILPDNTAIRQLASEFSVGLWAKGVRYGNREPRGVEGVNSADVTAASAVVDEALEDDPSRGLLTAAELLRSLDINPGAREALLARVEISAASDADEILAESLLRLGHLDDEPSPSLAGGNQTLSLAIAESLGDRVRLNDPVLRIRWSEDSVEAKTASGQILRGSACVIAVPASVFNRVEFTPELPEYKTEAIAGVGYGHAAKLFVPLGELPAVSAVMNVPERYWCWTETGEGEQLMPLLSCFAGSPASLRALEVEGGTEKWLESVARLRPDLALLPGEAILSTWDDDPWVGAAYSVSPTDQLTEALREPVGPLTFAGEHTAGPFHGLMEGAVRSGIAAAARLG